MGWAAEELKEIDLGDRRLNRAYPVNSQAYWM